jgi:DNA-directed RNA polymerase III subunit RPC4
VPNLSIQQPTVIKDEPTDAVSNPVVASDSASTNGQQSRDPPVTIKIEDNAKGKGKSEPSRPAHLPTLASGTPGKLRVYKSGKVTLNWGGTSLQIQKGMDSGFLQDIVMVRMNEDQQGSSGSGHPRGARENISGDALAFGQVRGKFVMTPDWDEVLG